MESLRLAEALVGKDDMSDIEFLNLMATTDRTVDHDGEWCGVCHQVILGATLARDMLAAGQVEDGMQKWAEENSRRWRESKFFKLWQEETAAGRDPHVAFADRGWEP